MSQIIALASKRNIDLGGIAEELRKRTGYNIVDTLNPSYTTHCNIKTSVVVIDPIYGPNNYTFEIFKYGIREAKTCVDAMIKMASLHRSNTQLIGNNWTKKAIPITKNTNTIIVGIYTKEDLEYITLMGAKVILITQDDNSKNISIMDDVLEKLITTSSNTNIISYYDKEAFAKITSLMKN